MARKLIVEIVGDASSLEREFKRSAAGAQRFERQMGQIGRGTLGGVFSSMGRQVAFASGGFLGAAGLVAGLKAAVNAASDLNEEVAKGRQVFGGSAAVVRAWARDAPEALKTTQSEALAAAGGFGAMLKTAGVANDQAATMSMTLTALGADMASFNNEDPTDMLDRLRSGLAGEAEPLRRFGVLLSEARVQQEAHRLGLIRGTQRLTEQQKVLARYSILLRDTVRQQGDVARTGGAFAGQQRELRARLTETAAALGKEMLPRLNDVITGLNEWLSAPGNQKRVLDDFAAGFNFVAASIERTASAVEWLNRLPRSHEGLLDILGDVNVPGGTPFGRNKTLWGRLAQPGGIVGGVGGGDFGGVSPRPDDRAVGPRVGSRGGFTGGGGGGGGGFVPSAGMRNRWFDSMISRRLDRVQDVRTLQGQIAALSAIAALVRQRLAKTKDVTRQQTLEDQLVGVYRERAGITALIAANKNERERLRLLEEAEDLAARRARSLERLRNAQASARAAFGELGQGPVLQGPLVERAREWGGKATARDFIADLREQVRAFGALQRDLATLRKRGVSQFAIDTLRGQGQAGAEEAHALAGASRGQLASFNRLVGQRRTMIQQAANVQVRSPRVTITAASVTVAGSRSRTSRADERAGSRAPGKI